MNKHANQAPLLIAELVVNRRFWKRKRAAILAAVGAYLAGARVSNVQLSLLNVEKVERKLR
jgi:hypothetical protein